MMWSFLPFYFFLNIFIVLLSHFISWGTLCSPGLKVKFAICMPNKARSASKDFGLQKVWVGGREEECFISIS